jgi:hypothetical protein
MFTDNSNHVRLWVQKVEITHQKAGHYGSHFRDASLRIESRLPAKPVEAKHNTIMKIGRGSDARDNDIMLSHAAQEH